MSRIIEVEFETEPKVLISVKQAKKATITLSLTQREAVALQEELETFTDEHGFRYNY